MRRHLVIHQAQRIAVNGAAEHHFINPLGLRFHIDCFREAPGCVALGAATMEHTWFPGYAWRAVQCGNCEIHLGWMFASSADEFDGLIIDRLTSAGPTNK